MHCWYWVSDFCEDLGIDFILGHALYMKSIHGARPRTTRSIHSRSQTSYAAATSRLPMCTLNRCVPHVTCFAGE
jgi:hypothetical protein